MKKKINNINKDLIRRKKFIKSEIKKIVLLSIIQNLNSKPKIRALAIKKHNKINIKNSISKQKNNLCLKTGRFKGVLRVTQLSRHYVKKLNLTGSIQNLKIKSW